MLAQIRWILVSYITRPIVLALCSVAAIGLTVDYATTHQRPIVRSVSGSSVTYLTPQPTGFFPRLLPYLLLGAAVGIQLSSQFGSVDSKLIPHFGGSHTVVSLFLLQSIIGAAVVRWLVHGAGLWPALIVPTCYVALMVSFCSTVSLQGMQRRSNWLAGGLVIMGFLFLSSILAMIYSRHFDQRAVGEYPQSLLLFAVITVMTILYCINALTNLTRVEGDPGETRALQPAFPRQSQVENRWFSWQLRRRERTIEQLKYLPFAEENFWEHVQRWRQGNVVLPVLLPVVMFLSVLIATLAMDVGLRGFDNAKGLLQSSQGPWFTACVAPLALTIGQIGMSWRARTKVLGHELLRPWRRSAMLKEMAIGCAIDLIPIALLVALVLTTALFVRPDIPNDIFRMGASFTFLLLAAVPLFTGLTGLIVLYPGWKAFLSIFALYLATVAVMIFMVLGRLDRGSAIDPANFVAQLWIPALEGVLLCAFLSRKWFRMEFGRMA